MSKNFTDPPPQVPLGGRPTFQAPPLADAPVNRPRVPPGTAAGESRQAVPTAMARPTLKAPEPRGTAKDTAVVTKVQRPPARSTAPFNRFLYLVTRGRINPAPGDIEVLQALRQQYAEAIASQRYDHEFLYVVMSEIGGIGKTYLTAHTLRLLTVYMRRAHMLGIDINNDHGFLAERLGIEQSMSLSETFANLGNLMALAQMQRLIGGDTEGVSVISAEPEERESTTGSDEVMFDAVYRHFRPSVTGMGCDAGTGMLKLPLNQSALRRSNQVILVTIPGIEGFKSAESMMNTLRTRGFAEHLKNAILVVSKVPVEDLKSKGRDDYSFNHIREILGGNVRVVLPICMDPYLATRKQVRTALLSPLVDMQYHHIAYEATRGFHSRVPVPPVAHPPVRTSPQGA